MTHLKLKKRSGANTFEYQMGEVQGKSIPFEEDEGLVLYGRYRFILKPYFLYSKNPPRLKKHPVPENGNRVLFQSIFIFLNVYLEKIR